MIREGKVRFNPIGVNAPCTGRRDVIVCTLCTRRKNLRSSRGLAYFTSV